MGAEGTRLKDTIILCYHAVSPDWPAPLSVTPRQLEDQLALLVGRGFTGATFDDLVHDSRAAGRRLVVTFDDAYRSVLTRAYPILERLGLPATVFAPTGWVGTERPMRWPGIDHWLAGPHESELVPLSWEELDRLAEAGWGIGSHTHSHQKLTSLGDSALERELHDSRLICEHRLGRPCHSVAYPYGDTDDRVLNAARAAGYRGGVGLGHSLRHEDSLEWPRVGVYHGDDSRRFWLKVWRPLRWLRASRAWPR